MPTPTPDTVLPVLRPELELRPGPDERDGTPTYVLHDPLRNTFDQLTWGQAEVLRRLRRPQFLGQLTRDLRANTTLRLADEDVLRLCTHVAARGLTHGGAAAQREPAPERPRGTGLRSLLRLLVYARIPLLHPDTFLARTLPLVRWLGHPASVGLLAVIGVLGLLVLAQRFDAYAATFPYFFNVAGAAAFAATLIALKTLHEFSHAYVAKALGCRVPRMGVALVFLLPVAYADVTDTWRLARRRQRIQVALAGVLAELAVAGPALIVWALTGPGLLHALCFVASSVTLLTTVLLNLNPAMRYDGYYVLCDLLGIDNLQPRAFAYLRWLVRRYCGGLDVPTPEPRITRRQAVLLTGYAVGATTYRLFLYLALSVLLYHRVTKALGIVLFTAALWLLLIQPVLREVAALWQARRRLRLRMGGAACVLGLAALVGWAAWPLPRWSAVPAVTVAPAVQVVYAPGAGYLAELRVTVGTTVRCGDVLFTVSAPELERRAELADLEVARIELELATLAGDARYKALLPQKLEERVRAAAQQESVRLARERLSVRAQLDGVVMSWDSALRPGAALARDQVLGRIVPVNAVPEIRAYIPDRLVREVAAGQEALFRPAAGAEALEATVMAVAPVRTTLLAHRGLASVAGGDIAVRPNRYGELEVLESWYEVQLQLNAPAPALRCGQTGKVWLQSQRPRSRIADLARNAGGMLLRESGF